MVDEFFSFVYLFSDSFPKPRDTAKDKFDRKAWLPPISHFIWDGNPAKSGQVLVGERAWTLSAGKGDLHTGLVHQPSAWLK